MLGGGGNDRMFGLTGNDTILGGDGDDFLDGGSGDDSLFGESGNDILAGGSDSDRLFGGAQNDRLFGQDGNDRLFGESGNDMLRGGAGNDRLFGGAQNDRLFGENGNDRLTGEAGNDRLTGGQGRDVFSFARTGNGTDRITDFQDGLDRIAINDVSFSGLDIDQIGDNVRIHCGNFDDLRQPFRRGRSDGSRFHLIGTARLFKQPQRQWLCGRIVGAPPRPQCWPRPQHKWQQCASLPAIPSAADGPWHFYDKSPAFRRVARSAPWFLPPSSR